MSDISNIEEDEKKKREEQRKEQMKTLGERIRSAREGMKLTQGQLAEKIDIHGHDTISGWENGTQKPDIFSIYNLCKVLDVDLGYLFAEYKEKTFDMKYICEYTGLSEKAVNILHRLKGTKRKEALTALNDLIETGNVFVNSVLMRIPQYIKCRAIYEMKQPKQFNGNNDTEKTLSEANYKDLKRFALEKMDIALFSLSKGIVDSIEAIYKNRKKDR